MHHVRKSVLIRATPEEVYHVARDCFSWNELYESLSPPRRVKGDCGVGTIVECQYTVMGIRVPVTIEVTEDYKSEEECRWSCIIRGPITGTQNCVYRARGNITEAEFDLEYTFPTSILGKLADRLFIENMQQSVIDETLENLRLISEHQVRMQTL